MASQVRPKKVYGNHLLSCERSFYSLYQRSHLFSWEKKIMKCYVVRRDDTKATINEAHPSSAKIFLQFFKPLYFVHHTLKIFKACLVSYHTPQVFPNASPIINTKNLTLPFPELMTWNIFFPPNSRLIKVFTPKISAKWSIICSLKH